MSPIYVVLTLLAIGQAETDEVSLKAMQQRAQDCRVTLTNDATAKPQLVTTPVFRYSDEVRRIEDAGIWLWTERGRPVAAMKVEHYQPGIHPRQWLYCFASLSPELVSAEWKGDPDFRARKPGVTWRRLDDKPATTRAARLVQMREIARRISAEIMDFENNVRQMRLLPRPLYRYDESLGNTEDGALFGFTGTGTNPDMILLVDLTKDDGWRIGFAGMTADGLTARLADKAIWSVPHAGGKGFVFDNWTWFLPAK